MLDKYYRYLKPVKIGLLCIALLLLIFVLVAHRQHAKKSVHSTIFVVDVSNSMNVQDISLVNEGNSKKENLKMSRLDATKHVIKQLVQQNELPQSFGLIIFSQTANYFIPPTDDTLTFLKYIDTLSSNHLPFGGTNIVQALDLLLDNNDSGRTIILFSDMGEDPDYELDKLDLLKQQLEYQQMVMVGVGSVQGGEVKDADGSLVLDQGAEVVSIRNDDSAKILKKHLKAKHYALDAFDDIDFIVDRLQVTDSKKWLSQKQIDMFLPVIGVLILLGL